MYVSPFGRPLGLRARLVQHRANLSNRSYPWHGTGLIADMELIMKLLNKREWLEAMHRSDDPEAQRFAAELLADDETLDAVQSAADRVQLVGQYEGQDPVQIIEQLDSKATDQARALASIRKTLESAGVVDDETPDDMLPAMLQALLS